MNWLIRSFIFLALIISLFFTFTYISIERACNKYLQNTEVHSITIPTSSTNISFGNIEPYFGIWSIGIKVTDIVEKQKKWEISHRAPLYISFNPFTFNFDINYEGKSTATLAGAKFDIDSKTSLSFDIGYSFKIFALLLKSNFIKLINYIDFITVNIDRILVKNGEEEIYESHDNKLTLIVKHDYYTSLSDIITKPPKYYSISGKLLVTKAAISELPKYSLLLGYFSKIELDCPFFVKLDSKALKFDLNKPFENAKIKLICQNCTSGLIDIDLKSELDSTEQNTKTNISSDFTLKQGFFDINLVSSYLKYLPISTENLSQIDYTRKYTLKIDGDFKASENQVKTKYTNFILRSADGEGILSSGLCSIDLNKNLYNISFILNAGIVLSKAKLLINHLYDFLTMDSNDTKEKIELDKDVLFHFAKKISDFPASKSDDLMLKVTLDTEKNEYSIGDKNIGSLFNTYNSIKTEQILARAAKTSNPTSYIKKVAPELENLADDLVQMIPSGKKIKKDLWKKLIK